MVACAYSDKNRVNIPETVIHRSWSVVSFAFCDICTKHPLSSFSCLIYAPAFPMIIPAVELGMRIFTYIIYCYHAIRFTIFVYFSMKTLGINSRWLCHRLELKIYFVFCRNQIFVGVYKILPR